jgi:hypothetical protein
LRDGEEDLLPEFVVLDLPEQLAEVGGVLPASGLAEPEDRLLAQRGRRVGPLGVGPERLPGPWAVLL